MNNQSNTYQLPIEVVEQLLCSHCNCYISSGPVKMQPDGGSICGRCSPSSSEVFGRNLLFETAMSKFTFPCRYKRQGCNQSILFGKTAEHEDACPYQTFLCPSLPAGICSENLTAFDVYKHFNANHLNLITKDGRFKLDLEQSFQSNLLMIVDTIVVIIEYNYDKNRNVLNLNVDHFSNGNLQTLHYKTQIISGLDADRILHFKELPCHRYQSPTVIDRNENNLKMSNYLPALDNPSFIFVNILVAIRNKNSSGTSISTEVVIESPVRTETSLVTSVSSQTENHEDVAERALVTLANVMCFYCKCYCIPPVFEGLNNYRIKVISCTKCKRFLKNSTQKINEQYPCRWRTCTFIGNESNIAKHDEDCLFQSCFCPIDFCQQKYFTRNNLLEHMLGHGIYCPDPKRMIIKLHSFEKISVDPSVKIYFTLFEEKVLTFNCRLSGTDFWILKSTGCSGFAVDIHFEHGHCRMKTETLCMKNNIDLQRSSTTVTNILPGCFQFCNDMEAIVKVEPFK